MDAQTSWQAFACTGNILRYLDYKQKQPEETGRSVDSLMERLNLIKQHL